VGSLCWVGLLLITVGACSSGGSDGAEPASTTTPAPTTSAPEEGGDEDEDDGATPTSVDPETAIREVHTRFMTELFDYDERTDDPEELLVLVEELTTGAQLERMRTRIAAGPDLDERFASPGYESNIEKIELDGEYATVLDCSLDRGEAYSLDGELVTPAAEQHEYRETLLVNVDGRWLVTDFRTGGDQRCEP
jgi:hypothetical protein